MSLILPNCVRDRREAASDETISTANLRIYGRGSQARSGGAQRARRFDRSYEQIRAVVLHQTAGNSLMSERQQSRIGALSDHEVRSRHRLDRITAHFVVLNSGDIFYTHDVRYILNDAGGRYGIDIEFCGSWGHGETPSGFRLSPAAIRSARDLMWSLYYSLTMLDYVHPHGQVQAPNSAGRRGKAQSCPGPDIWVNVGEYAVREIGYSAEADPALYRHATEIDPAQSNSAWSQEI